MKITSVQATALADKIAKELSILKKKNFMSDLKKVKESKEYKKFLTLYNKHKIIEKELLKIQNAS